MVRLGPDQFLVSDCPAYGQSAPSLKRWSVSDLQAPGRGRCPGVAHGQVASALSGRLLSNGNLPALTSVAP
jgi:hypothetical protein